jgi:hypothetical protein
MCKACNREAAEEEGNYCELHAKAYKSLVLKYDKWNRALDICWKDYLREIIKNPLTGVWAKEVAQLILMEARAA